MVGVFMGAAIFRRWQFLNLFYYQLFLGGPYPLLQMTISVCDRKQYKSAQSIAGCYKWIEADGHMSHTPHTQKTSFILHTYKIHSRIALKWMSAPACWVCFRWRYSDSCEFFLYIYFSAENHSPIQPHWARKDCVI